MTQPAKTHPLHVAQAILTRYHGPTSKRAAYYSATASRGTRNVTIRNTVNYDLNETQRHAEAAEALKAKFTAEDAARTPPHPTATNPWNQPTQQGALPDGSHAHTYANR